ncbi:MAG: hypothetical protein ABFD12_02245 [Syntrophorhabdus sp.]
MRIFKCPRCGKEVPAVRNEYGYMATCCKRVLFVCTEMRKRPADATSPDKSPDVPDEDDETAWHK